MPIFRIPERLVFPDPSLADPSGLLGVGGDLHPDRLLLAYRMGIFPWFSDDRPYLWWSPDPRMVLFLDELHVPRSLGKRIRQRRFEIRMDTAFDQVLDACARTPRPDQPGTWITEDMRAAYQRMHRLGFAHSVEAWQDGELVGGLYGIAVGRLYSGESMFSTVSDASKVAFVHLARQLQRWGFPLVDCQVHTRHLERFGAREIRRRDYLELIQGLVEQADQPGPWHFDNDFQCDG